MLGDVYKRQAVLIALAAIPKIRKSMTAKQSQIEASPKILQKRLGRAMKSAVSFPLFVLIINMIPRTLVQFHLSRYPVLSRNRIEMYHKIRKPPSGRLSKPFTVRSTSPAIIRI